MSEYLIRAEKVVSRIRELAEISEDTAGITRRYGTGAARVAREKVMGWMREAGLEVRVDAIGNVRGRWGAGKGDPAGAAGKGGLAGVEGARAKTLVIGSHLDTVVNAGKWDGPLGVLVGIDLLEHLREGLSFSIELIAFCDEEGVRFHTTYLGSKVVAGSFERSLLERKDVDGVCLAEAMVAFGGDPGRLEEGAMRSGEWLGYFEIHIEQGPILYERNIPVAPVVAIAGQVRVELVFTGMAGHAGTVPMDQREDALCGAAEFILAVEELAGGKQVGDGVRVGAELVGAGGKLVATVGKIEVLNGASNVIPGKVICSVDIRSGDAGILSRGHAELKVLCEEIAGRRGLGIEWVVVQESLPVVCDERMRRILGDCVASEGYPVLELVSGAGHDAVPVSVVSPVCMLFVRCFKGISHHPLEEVELGDLAAAIGVAEKFIHQL